MGELACDLGRTKAFTPRLRPPHYSSKAVTMRSYLGVVAKGVEDRRADLEQACAGRERWREVERDL